MAEVRVEELIGAAPELLYRLVSDITRMGEWGQETTSCRWLGGATGPAVGARFRGANRQGWRRWSTTCTVVVADPGRKFAFEVKFGPLTVSRWTYDFVADGDGCRVTESWVDQRPGWILRVYPIVMGRRDRASLNRDNMRATLARLHTTAKAVRT